MDSISTVSHDRPVVLACSGPSLPTIDPFAPGYPVAAISTAIRVVKKPAYWFMIDRLRPIHGPEGAVAMQDASIMKIMPARRRRVHNPTPSNVVWLEMNRYSDDEGRTFMDGQGKMLRSGNKSVLMAIQWLCEQGFNRLIFAGCDLSPGYAYAHRMTGEADRKRQRQALDQVYDPLVEWTPIAKSLGITFLSWSPGRLNDIMESFDGNDGPAAADAF